jgi:hypothetical protein
MQIVLKRVRITSDLSFPIYPFITVPDLNFKLGWMWPLCECDNSTRVCRKKIFTYFLFKLNKFVLNTLHLVLLFELLLVVVHIHMFVNVFVQILVTPQEVFQKNQLLLSQLRIFYERYHRFSLRIRCCVNEVLKQIENNSRYWENDWHLF